MAVQDLGDDDHVSEDVGDMRCGRAGSNFQWVLGVLRQAMLRVVDVDISGVISIV